MPNFAFAMIFERLMSEPTTTIVANATTRDEAICESEGNPIVPLEPPDGWLDRPRFQPRHE